jgi:hypothetical protein
MHARDMRVSDAERERVAAFLRDQALEGRLDNDELEERLGLAYGAVTAGDLERLIADLPHTRVPAATRMAPRRREPPRTLLGVSLGLAALAAIAAPGLIGLAAIILVAMGIAAVAAVAALGFVFGPFILIGLLIVLAARRRRPRRHHHWHPHPH